MKKGHKKTKYDIAVIGLGVMGSSLARNIASKGFNVIGWDRHFEKAEAFYNEYGTDNIEVVKSFKEVHEDLKKPGKYLLMVPAGAPVDDVMKKLQPHLDKGDIVIDAGNSLFTDTQRRTEEWAKKGIHYVGMGVSGGEEGALRGPSIMPGGTKGDYKNLKPILEKIAAKDFNGGPCVTHIGTDGAGHYVKMVHNGIEYGVMQMMAEGYSILKNVYGLTPPEIAKIFTKYNKGKLKSYLFEIATPILEREDDFKKGYLIDYILDKAGQKGTGRWVAIDALKRGAVLPTITMAVYARSVSAFKDERIKLAKKFKKPKVKPTIPLNKFVKLLEDALYAGMISSYAQGMELIRIAAEEEKWKLNFAEITRIWEGGCIIRADLLNFLHKAYTSAKGKHVHLFEIKEVQKALEKDLPAWRKVVGYSAELGVPAPALGTSLAYFESITTGTLSANFIQGLRDFFGAHTYERIDKKGTFHTPWSNLEL